ncbi:class I SAM-dependent methyltransferase [Blastococcus sp. HT6-30]|uniref:class I SAM-dependent methyltransferase n=1 Tax=Blastococcus sp. HT6-30 TaxID=3144843 RepID=UPI0032198806
MARHGSTVEIVRKQVRAATDGRAGRAAALPARAGIAAKHAGRHLGQLAKWLAHSKEHTNFTVHLQETNHEHLAWFVADLTGITVQQARGYIQELREDEELQKFVRHRARVGPRSGLIDPEARFGRRLGWYAITRARQPRLVVECGIDKGLGTLAFAAALRRNEMEGGTTGRVLAIDVNPSAGALIGGPYAAYVDQAIAPSVDVLRSLDEQIDVFLHDSDHNLEYEQQELLMAAEHLAPRGIVLSDNPSLTLPMWAEAAGRHFAFFQERPQNSWLAGSGFGVALDRKAFLALG